MSPLWFKLIQHRKKSGGFALTLPFLIGALRSPPGHMVKEEQLGFQELHALLTSMRDETPDSHYVHIGECDRLRQPVVNLTSSFFKPNTTDCSVHSLKRNKCLLAIQDKYIPDRLRGIDSAAESLWQISAQDVIQGGFSFRSGLFLPFNAEDIVFIEGAFSAPDDDET